MMGVKVIYDEFGDLTVKRLKRGLGRRSCYQWDLFLFKKKLRSILEDEGWREKKVGEGLVDNLEEGSQCFIYLFFTLIDSDGF